MMHRWNTQKVDAEKPLIPSSQNLRAHKLRFLQKTRRAVLFSGIAALSTWAVIGYLTDWTGGNLQALLSARLQRCHGSFRAGLKDKGEEFTWESVSIAAVSEPSDLADFVRIGDPDRRPGLSPLLERPRVRQARSPT